MGTSEAILLAVQLTRLAMDAMEAAQAGDLAKAQDLFKRASDAVAAADAAWVAAGKK